MLYENLIGKVWKSLKWKWIFKFDSNSSLNEKNYCIIGSCNWYNFIGINNEMKLIGHFKVVERWSVNDITSFSSCDFGLFSVFVFVFYSIDVSGFYAIRAIKITSGYNSFRVLSIRDVPMICRWISHWYFSWYTSINTRCDSLIYYFVCLFYISSYTLNGSTFSYFLSSQHSCKAIVHADSFRMFYFRLLTAEYSFVEIYRKHCYERETFGGCCCFYQNFRKMSVRNVSKVKKKYNQSRVTCFLSLSLKK